MFFSIYLLKYTHEHAFQLIDWSLGFENYTCSDLVDRGYYIVRDEVLKMLEVGIIYHIFDSQWVSLVQVVPKKSGITVVENEKNKLISTRVQTGWRVCIDYRKLNNVTGKDNFTLPFIDQMLERLAGHAYYCFLDGYSGYNKIPNAHEDQEKTRFSCPFGTFAYRRMPFLSL